MSRLPHETGYLHESLSSIPLDRIRIDKVTNGWVIYTRSEGQAPQSYVAKTAEEVIGIITLVLGIPPKLTPSSKKAY